MCPAGSSDRGPRYQAAAELALRNILVRCRLACYTAPKCSRSPKLRHRGTAVTAGPRQLGTKAAGQAGSPRRAALVEPHAASTRCSRSALLTLLIAPAEPDPEGLPGAGRLQLGSETAARTCQRAACGLPAAAALRAAGALSASPVCSGPAAAGASLFGPWSVRQLLGAFGGAGGAARGIGWEQKRILW